MNVKACVLPNIMQKTFVTKITKDTIISCVSSMISTKLAIPIPMQVFIQFTISSADDDALKTMDIHDFKKEMLIKLPMIVSASILDVENDEIALVVEQMIMTLTGNTLFCTYLHYVIKLALFIVNIFLILY